MSGKRSRRELEEDVEHGQAQESEEEEDVEEAVEDDAAPDGDEAEEDNVTESSNTTVTFEDLGVVKTIADSASLTFSPFLSSYARTHALF